MRLKLAVFSLLAVSALAQPSQSDRYKYAPLLAAAKLWNMVRYLHPQVTGNSTAWDEALVSVLPRIEAAHSDEDLAAALDTMLATLNDPCTRIAHGLVGKGVSVQSSDSDTMVIHAGNGDLSGSLGAGLMIKMGIPQSTHIVWDLRGTRMPFSLSTRADLAQLSQGGIGYAYREHSGYPTPDGATRHYFSALKLVDPQPSSAQQRTSQWRQVYLVDKDTAIPVRALIDQVNGRTAILSEDPPRDRQAGFTELVPLIGKVVAEVRVAELRYSDGTTGFAPTRVVLNRGDEAVKASISSMNSGVWNMPGERPKFQPSVSAFRDMPYAESPYPSREMRLLAAMRIWGVLHYFHPYVGLMSAKWDDAFIEFLPRFAEAKDAAEYHRAVAEMVARTDDPGCMAKSNTLQELFGTAAAPFDVRFIENQPVITKVFKAGAVKAGDVIVAIDGKAVQARLDELLRAVAGPTRETRINRAAPLLATAASGSTVKLTVKRADGNTTDVDVQLMAGNTQSVPASRTGNAIRLLNERTGYVDLERVEASQVDGIFDQFKDMAAIIFDLRGYPRSHALAIAARIAPQSLGVAAELFHNVVGVGSGDGNIRFQETELRIPKSTKPQYKGKVVALVDEMTSTLGGDSAMCLKSAGAVLIGSHTFARFTQTSSTFDVPGGIRIVFSGSIPRWPGGKLLSPEGVVPDVEVRPTIASIRENKDDVLQAAMKYLESK